jgi:hypothetical protein
MKLLNEVVANHLCGFEAQKVFFGAPEIQEEMVIWRHDTLRVVIFRIYYSKFWIYLVLLPGSGLVCMFALF